MPAMGGMRPEDVRYRRSGDNTVLRIVLFDEWRSRCYWCGLPKGFHEIEIDHILPHTITHDGLRSLIEQHGLPDDFTVHAPANLAPICGPCNREKSNGEFAGTLVTGKLARARALQDRVILRAVNFDATNAKWIQATVEDLRWNAPAEIAARILRLAERAQPEAAPWRLDFQTTPDGVCLIFSTQDTGQTAGQPHGLPPLFSFPSDTDDDQATEHRLTELARYGGELTIEARYLVPAPDDATPSLAQILGLDSPDDHVLIGAGLAQLDPAATFQLALVSASGVVKARATLAAIAANRGDHGGRIILADSTGIFTVHVQVDRAEDGETVTSSFSNEGFNGKYPYATRPALDLFQDADETDHLELRLNNRPFGTTTGPSAAHWQQHLRDLRYAAHVVAALERLQTHTGEIFQIPEHLSPAECADVLVAAQLVEGETVNLPSRELLVTVNADRIQQFLAINDQQIPGFLRITGAGYVVPCGPHQINVGRAEVLAQVKLINTAELRAAIGTGKDAKARYGRHADTDFKVRLLPEKDLAGLTG